jgi:alpha-N-arabinofuranosidase
VKKLLISALLTIISLFSFGQETATLTVSNNSDLVISRDIYGQFAEHLGRSIYDGFYRNGKIRMDIVDALKEIEVPNLRWPGGCFADRYHWRDGIGPADRRPTRVNADWGMVTEDNSFGTEEFMQLCQLIGCQPYIAGNMSSGSPKEMNEWLEYLNYGGKSELSDLRAANRHPAPYAVSLWGVGNESWGCGGSMTPEYYSSMYKQYANFCDQYPGAPQLRKIASDPQGEDYNWTDVFMKNVSPDLVWGLSLHYYTIPTSNWGNKGSATSFSEAEYFNTMNEALKMDHIIATHSGIMDKYDPEKRVALVVDEWGVWANAEPGTNPAFLYQQNSFRDALVAASTLNIFNNHCDRVRVACLAQSVNVLQSIILTKGDQMLLTPTYAVFDLYKVHQDASYLPIQLNSPDYVLNNYKITAVNASASQDKNGNIHISLVNLDPHHSIAVSAALPGIVGTKFTDGKILTSPKVTDINTFENPHHISIQPFSDAKVKDGQLIVNLPPTSIVVITLKGTETKIIGKAATAGDMSQLLAIEAAAKQSGDYQPLCDATEGLLKAGGPGFNPALLNNLAWDIFAGSTDKAQLKLALGWSKTVAEKTSDPGFIDTYANLLYKLGQKQAAIAAETKALNLAADSDKAGFQTTLDKMQKGTPTW